MKSDCPLHSSMAGAFRTGGEGGLAAPMLLRALLALLATESSPLPKALGWVREWSEDDSGVVLVFCDGAPFIGVPVFSV